MKKGIAALKMEDELDGYVTICCQNGYQGRKENMDLYKMFKKAAEAA